MYDPSEEKILYERGIDDVSNIASLTKIMTTITAIDLIEDLDKMVTIDRNVLNEIPYDASIAGLREGDIREGILSSFVYLIEKWIF